MPPYIFGSRRASTSRFAPLRTSTCIRSVDERIQSGPHDVRGSGLDARAVVAEEDEIDRLSGALLVAEQRLPGALPVDRDRLRVELGLDLRGTPRREPERCEQAESDCVAVRQLEAGRCLERVG